MGHLIPKIGMGIALVALLLVSGCSEESSPADHGHDGDVGVDVDGEIGEVGSDETGGDGPRDDSAVEAPDIDDGGPDETDAPPPADAAGVVAVSIPDSIVCNTAASASITMRNDGSATWTTDLYALGMVGDADPFLATGDGPRVALPGGTPVPPGGTVTFELTLHAPRTAGMYATDYQMVHEGVAWFGEIVARDIEVTGSCTDPVGEDNAEVAEIHYPTTLTAGMPSTSASRCATPARRRGPRRPATAWACRWERTSSRRAAARDT
jgi:hypothetical protein